MEHREESQKIDCKAHDSQLQDVLDGAVDAEARVTLDDTLEAVLRAGLDEAKAKMEAGEDVVPFTALAVGETLFIETHPGDDVEFCFSEAERTVSHATGAVAYAFCYDGYVETDDGTRDVLIAEGGLPGEPEGHAIGYLYDMPEEGEDGEVIIEDEPIYIGAAPNFMAFAVDAPEELEEIEETE